MPSRRPPNILLIMDDQHQASRLSCQGTRALDTPNLDALAREGVLVERAYGQPTCTPSRVSFLTGRLPHAHGAYSVGVDMPAGNPNLARELTRAGYRTALIGKSHVMSWGNPASPEYQIGATQRWRGRHGPYAGYQHVELSFGHASWGASGHYRLWLYEQGLTDADIHDLMRLRPVAGEGQIAAYDWLLPPELYDSTWATTRAIQQLRTARADDGPLFLAVNFQGPHHPFVAPAGAPVDRPDLELPTHVPGELADKPPHYRAAYEGRLVESGFVIDPEFPMPGQNVGQDFRRVDDGWARAALGRYHYAIEQIDAQVGRLLTALEELGQADDTLVLFTSDHGELGGAHGLWMKGPFSYEEAIAIPLIVRWPRGGLVGGRRSTGLTSLTDLAPTLLAAAGVAAPPSMDDGLDLLPQWRGERTVRDELVLEYLDDPRLLVSATLVTAEHKLTAYLGGVYAGREHEVGEFSLHGDGELVNRWHDPDRATRKQRDYLLDRLHDTVPPVAEWNVPPRLGGV